MISSGLVRAMHYVLLVRSVLADPVALPVLSDLRTVRADDLQRREHPPQQEVLAPACNTADRVQVPLLVERLLTHRARNLALRPSATSALRPIQNLRLFVEPLCDAVATEEVGTTRQLRAVSSHMHLADLANEFGGLAQELVLLNLNLFDLCVPFLRRLRLLRKSPAGHVVGRLQLCVRAPLAYSFDRRCCRHLFLLLLLLPLLVLSSLALLCSDGLLLLRGGIWRLVGVLGLRRHNLPVFELPKLEGVVDRLVETMFVLLVVVDVVLDAVTDDSQISEYHCVVVQGSEHELELANMPMVSIPVRLELALPGGIAAAEGPLGRQELQIRLELVVLLPQGSQCRRQPLLGPLALGLLELELVPAGQSVGRERLGLQISFKVFKSLHVAFDALARILELVLALGLDSAR
mmetsp:Transcript_34763/g.100162  ORF Transcript_34763/g.100162 Transcript_34763/m.100162 type:complete len:407 (+) Transcript_34763:1052-2272(+)